MSSITVHLEVPEFIGAGLLSGEMERVGGVIINRQSGNNEAIAWIRQVGQVGQTIESSGDMIESVMRSTGLSATTILNLLTSVMPLVNIAMAGYSLLEIITDIRSQHPEIARIYERIEEEFWQDRMANLVAALEKGERLHVVENPAFAHELVGFITDSLLETREHLRVDFNDVINSAEFTNSQKYALRFHAMSIYVAAMVVRSWLEIGEYKLALDWLSSIMRAQKERTRLLVTKLLRKPTALYFHESVSKENFERYLGVEQWLRGKRDFLPDLVKENRKRFWDDTALDRLFETVPVNRKRLIEPPFYEESLPLAEVAIENYLRLEGFELELKSMCFPFKEWEAYASDKTDNHDGYVMLVNDSVFNS